MWNETKCEISWNGKVTNWRLKNMKISQIWKCHKHSSVTKHEMSQNIKCNKLLNLTQYELSQIVNLINGKCHKSLKINKMLNETKYLTTFC